MPAWTKNTNFLILSSAIWIIATGNQAFFSLFSRAYPWQADNVLGWLVVITLNTTLLVLFLGLLAWGRLAKPILIAILILAAVSGAFMDSYGVVLNDEMIRNAMHTNLAEVSDLINWRFVSYFVGLALLPAILVWRSTITPTGWRHELVNRLKLIALLIFLLIIIATSASAFLASFARNNKAIRTYANPLYPIYSAAWLVNQKLKPATLSKSLQAIGQDAQISPQDKTRDLLVLVVGETARADHFGINGYARNTTPELQKANVISLSNVQACGTSTAYSVPCMFSSAGARRYTPEGAGHEENLLDVLRHAGVHVVWLDNNSSSLGVADRNEFIDFRKPENNPLCDEECRDEGMAISLQRIIDRYRKGDVVIVLHQMGNHGPAYFKRYPLALEQFSPACRNKDLAQCSREEIVNAYDNAIAYTDRFLGKVIDVLKQNDKNFETALFYFSDHGESLGENGIYLHGMPNAIAPKAQTHVPGVLWFGSTVDHRINQAILRQQSGNAFSHDNIFHTVLGFLEIDSTVYQTEQDILHPAKRR